MVVPECEIHVATGSNVRVHFVPNIDWSGNIISVNGKEANNGYFNANWLFSNFVSNNFVNVTFHEAWGYTYRTINNLKDFIWNGDQTIPADAISPDSIEYLGAFKLPYTDYAGALAYNPNGNPDYQSNSDSNFPGSLFVVGYNHATGYRIREMSIPTPKTNQFELDELKFDELNSASVINGPVLPYQGFPTELEVINCIEYDTKTDRIFFGGNQVSYGNQCLPALGAISSDFSISNGTWHLDNLCADLYAPRFMFTVPETWANNNNLGEKRLLLGRGRQGCSVGCGGRLETHAYGPKLYATAPWENGWAEYAAELDFKHILFYTNISKKIKHWRKTDDCLNFFGGAFVENGNQAIIMIGPLGFGNNVYDHTMYTDFKEVGLYFFDVNDIEQMLAGNMLRDDIQPYAYLKLNDYALGNLFRISNVTSGQNKVLVGKSSFNEMAYDKERNLLYLSQYKTHGTYASKSMAHVFKVNPVPEPFLFNYFYLFFIIYYFNNSNSKK